ncbi:MAG: flagellar biosynthesis protein FlhB [Armatimonadetes bacterium]|nr:flagellar biosynthesis protein FlhB [Armatimonadota bacterium]
MAFSDQAQQKTEAPTPRRLQEARRKGQVAKSRDFSAAVVFMAAVLFSYLLLPNALAGWERQLNWYFTNCLHFPVNEEGLIGIIFVSLRLISWMFLPFLLLLVGVSLAVHLFQTGFIFAPDIINPSLERLNPINGLRRIFSLRSLVELVKSIFKVAVVAAVSFYVVKAHLPVLLLVFTRAPGAAFGTVAKALLDVAAAAGGAYLALSLGDLLYQRWEHIRGLRMTKQEVKEELKHTEGDPLVKSWQRRRQRQIALNLIRAEVPRATVVVTNPVRLAVALRYEEKETEAPVVTAKGAGDLARQIRTIALENNVPVVTNPEVARILYHQVEIGQQIPVALYQAVAEILAFVYKLRGRRVI